MCWGCCEKPLSWIYDSYDKWREFRGNVATIDPEKVKKKLKHEKYLKEVISFIIDNPDIEPNETEKLAVEEFMKKLEKRG